MLVSKDVLREINNLSDIELPCCFRELGRMKSVKIFIWKYPKLSFKKRKMFRESSMYIATITHKIFETNSNFHVK